MLEREFGFFMIRIKYYSLLYHFCIIIFALNAILFFLSSTEPLFHSLWFSNVVGLLLKLDVIQTRILVGLIMFFSSFLFFVVWIILIRPTTDVKVSIFKIVLSVFFPVINLVLPFHLLRYIIDKKYPVKYKKHVYISQALSIMIFVLIVIESGVAGSNINYMRYAGFAEGVLLSIFHVVVLKLMLIFKKI